MAEHERHLQEVTEEYVPVDPKYVSESEVRQSAYGPMPGVIKLIHDTGVRYARFYERALKERRAEAAKRMAESGIDYRVGGGFRASNLEHGDQNEPANGA